MSTDIVVLAPVENPPFEETTEMPASNASGSRRSSPPASGTTGATYPLTDLGNAERLVERHGKDLLFTHSHGWLCWDGTRWVPDESGEAMRRAKDTVRGMYAEAGMVGTSGARTDSAEHAIDSERCSRLHAMLNLAESEAGIAIVASKFDADPWLLNVANGTIDLRTGELCPHRREDLITKIAPVFYDPEAECPRWNKFLEEVQPDPCLRAYLRRLAGYSATGVVRDHALPIFYGSGRNGKGVYTNANQHVLGDYARIVPTEVLMAKQLDDHPTGRMVLFGCRLAIASETEQNRGLATAVVKLLTGGDPITARLMRKDYVTFVPTHKLVLATNHRPVIKETKDAIWDRVHLIPWNQRFPLEMQDKELGEKLKAEASGILRWMVEGCLEWQRIGLAPPETVVAATAQYRKDMDLLGDFFAECCVLEAGAQVSRPTLRRAYERWAEEVGQKHTLDPKGFADALRERGCMDVPSLRETGRPTPVRGWKGIRLRTDKDVDTYPPEDTDSGKHANNARHEASTPERASTPDYVSTGPTGAPAKGATRVGGDGGPGAGDDAPQVHHPTEPAPAEPPAVAADAPAPPETPTAEREVFDL